MRIDIWSDVVCPWCYIGKRRLEAALERLTASGALQPGQPEVVWHSFELDPSAPKVPTLSVAEHLGRKYGGGIEAGRQMTTQVTSVAAQEGLEFRLDEAQRANTTDAHRVLHLALEHGGPGLMGALEEALFAAYFTQAENVADQATLTRIAAGVGLPADLVHEVLAGDAFSDAVADDIVHASQLGATGVPFFVFDNKYAISGAQPVDTFVQVMERALSERQVIQVLPADLDGDGAACGPDGCEI